MKLDWLRKHPLLFLSEERVRVRAYFRSRDQPNEDAVANWLAAEKDEIRLFVKTAFIRVAERDGPLTETLNFEDNYEPIFCWNDFGYLDTPLPPLGTRSPRRCSLCGRTRPEAKFKTVAHVLPELLGAKSVITLDECDDCNHAAGRDFETDLGNMLLPDRAVVGMRGKDGVVRLAFEKEGTSIGRSPDGRLVIETRDGGRNILGGITSEGAHVDAKRSRFRPRRVTKALAKMTWQALPPEYRDQFYGLRQYVRGEVNWPDARFYRVYIPGLARIALGVWRRLPSAPIDIPPLVTMAATANNLLLWMSPDLQTGTLLRPFFPPILRAMSGDAPAILEVHAPNDEHLPARMVRFNYGFRAAYLVQVGKPAPVRIEYLDEQGDGSIASMLTTPLAAETEMTGRVRYEIRGGDLIGVMIVDRLFDDPKITVNYRPDVPDRPGISIEPTLRLAAVLASGDPFRIIDVESGRDLIPVLSSQFVPLDLAVLADALRTAERLAVLRNRLGVDLPFPDSIDDDERLILGILAEGLRHGRVRQSTPGARRAVDLIGVVAIRLAEELQAGPGDFSAEHLTEWIFKGHVVDPGPVRLVFENIRIDEPLEQLRARAASVGPTDTVSVELCFDSVRHEFMDFLEVSCGDNSK